MGLRANGDTFVLEGAPLPPSLCSTLPLLTSRPGQGDAKFVKWVEQRVDLFVFVVLSNCPGIDMRRVGGLVHHLAADAIEASLVRLKSVGAVRVVACTVWTVPSALELIIP